MKFCTIEGLLKRLEKIEQDLKVCEKALNEFLDRKRRAFPRFYFVSVNDLLDILSNGNSPEKVNRHMSKIFQAIGSLVLKDQPVKEKPSATEMISCVGKENVPLVEPLELKGKVEIYLEDVIQAMRHTLKTLSQRSFKAIQEMERKKWIENDPA